MGVSSFSFDGVSTASYGIAVTQVNAYAAPQRSRDIVSVPGRNGDIIFDNGRYENIIVSYDCAVINTDGDLDDFREQLMSRTNYVQIIDSYHPDEYRLGFPVAGMIPSMEVMTKVGKFRVTFNCKPQRFIVMITPAVTIDNRSGSASVSLTKTNPTLFPSKPLIRVKGSGTLGINNDTITIAANSLSYIDIDCDVQDSRCGATNANQYISLSGDSYPELAPGSNTISVGPGLCYELRNPRWWKL